ncbi:hypothetical protein F9B74_05470 [Pelistega sp. NLN82]|uniref:Uncharacterized protein n=1 Tax=Pelistega ratti TaxID=2652177 RepID=A0A6L9Y7J7_9BURK|nr:hypothetical protein [Pelistega ratti]NEN75774.1 hypothetical protein [Pelistega ratti]
MKIDKQEEEQKDNVFQQEKKLSAVEEYGIVRFFTFSWIMVFSIILVTVMGTNDFSRQSLSSLMSDVMIIIIPGSLIFTTLRSGFYKFPLTIFTCNAVIVFFISHFLGNLSGAFGIPVKTMSVVVTILKGLFILIVAEAVISFYTKSYLQDRLYQGGLKGFLRILGSYSLSLYLVLIVCVFNLLDELSIYKKDLWTVFYQLFLLCIPFIVGFSFIRYKLPRLKANKLNLIIFCSIVFFWGIFVGEDTKIFSAYLGHLPYEEWQKISETLQPPSISYWKTGYAIRHIMLWFFVAEGILFLVLLWQDIFHSEDKK